MDFLQGKHFLVLGLGESGLPTLRWLLKHNASVRVADSRVCPPNLAAVQEAYPHLSIHCGELTPTVFEGVDIVVASPGVALKTIQPLVGQAEIIGDIELFARAIATWPSKVIGITGSNGKTTVTTMVGAICRQAGLSTWVAGNIGYAVLDALFDAEAQLSKTGHYPDVFVLELSSFQLETTESLHCNAATVLNISEDHMDRYLDIPDYAKAKARILQNTDVCVLNCQDALVCAMARPQSPTVWFGLDAPKVEQDYGYLEQSKVLVQGSQVLLSLNDFPLKGLHNVANALAACALTQAIGVDAQYAVSALKQFKGLPHRVEYVRSIKQVDFYDDSKGTNVGATVAALEGIAQPVILIAGGDGKGQDFTPLQTVVTQRCRAVVLIGRDAKLLRDTLKQTGVMLLDALDMEEALRLAWSQAQMGDMVLLSPACASLDMYKNYAHRAQVFIDAVYALAEQEGAA